MRAPAVFLAIAAAACSSAARAARNDVVIQWNQQVMATGGPHIERTLAMTHLAMFDAANAIDPRYAPYLTLPPAPAGANAEAATAAAAHGVLVCLFPAEHETLSAALASSLANVPEGVSRTKGVEFGDLVARRMYEARFSDANLAPERLEATGTAPGDYRRTDPEPPGPMKPDANARGWKPFAIGSVSQFRPDPPPALTSARYTRDFEEVRRRGGASSPRTADEEQIARWHTEPGWAQLNRIARSEAAADGRALVDHARLFALLNLAAADAELTALDAQSVYRFWRPVTAIRQADLDANPDTREDPAWSPFLPTPPSPEYPSALVTVQSAGARVLSEYFGRFHPFHTASSTLPGVTRAYENFDAFAEEGATAGILGGTQFRTSVDQGIRTGADVADWVLGHCLRALKAQ